MFKYIVLFIGIEVLFYNGVVTGEAEDARGSGESSQSNNGADGDALGPGSDSESSGEGGEKVDPADLQPLSEDYYGGFEPVSEIDGRNVSWNELNDTLKDAIYKELSTYPPDHVFENASED